MSQELPSDAARQTRIILIDRETPDVSSTAIRQRRAAGDAIDDLVEPPVARYIEQHGLYRSLPTNDSAPTPPTPAGRLHDVH
jgi:nicotinic acid mononucleotide adenylyltransferase